jgi:hypothetical protein
MNEYVKDLRGAGGKYCKFVGFCSEPRSHTYCDSSGVCSDWMECCVLSEEDGVCGVCVCVCVLLEP